MGIPVTVCKKNIKFVSSNNPIMEEACPAKDKLLFIINPISGTHQKKSIQKAIEQEFTAEEHEIIYTEYSGHAYEIVSQKLHEGYRYFIAVGGDGTVNEVASALVKTEGTLGIIPAGSGNGLARHLHIPVVNGTEAISIIRHHKIQSIDVGKVNGRYFFCTCGTGFDASVGKTFASDSRRGMMSYVRAIIHQYITYSPKSYILETENKEVTLKAFLITFANAGQYGNNAYIAPNALIDDGLLDMCVLSPFPKASTLDLGLRLFFKNIDQSPYIEIMRVTKATIRRKKGQKMVLHVDGEPVAKKKKKLKIRVISKGLQVMIPPSAKKRRRAIPKALNVVVPLAVKRNRKSEPLN
jgi:diacylglycerol kinase (ATP)